MLRALIVLLGLTPLLAYSQSKPMTLLTPDDSIVVSRESVQSKDEYDVIWSNIDFLNALFKEHIKKDEVSADALTSYYVDYYLAQMSNGGFSQFVYNSEWDVLIVEKVRRGLQVMGARQHLALFEEGASQVSAMGEGKLKSYSRSEYFGENRQRDQLASIDDRFFALKKKEDLIALNARWLKAHPKLIVIPRSEMPKEVSRRAAALPDQAARAARALADEPEYMKLIRQLCAKSGQKLDHVTTGDPSHKYQGKSVPAVHFITDKGHHYMINVDGKAMMFNGTSNTLIAEIDRP